MLIVRVYGIFGLAAQGVAIGDRSVVRLDHTVVAKCKGRFAYLRMQPIARIVHPSAAAMPRKVGQVNSKQYYRTRYGNLCELLSGPEKDGYATFLRLIDRAARCFHMSQMYLLDPVEADAALAEVEKMRAMRAADAVQS